MNKGQSVTAGALVLAGVLIQPFATHTSPVSSSPSPQTAAATPSAANSGATGEGPWIASCNYWSASRAHEDGKPTAAETSLKLKVDSERFHLNETASTPAETSCGEDRWGLPGAPSGGVKPDITAIIAAVPDPLRAITALGFDRTIDALLQAAAENEYLESYSWVPWKNNVTSDKKGENATETAEEQERERQPGLIILKYVGDDQGFLSYNRVIYLFLVGETPVLGMDGYQLENAFRYEDEVKIQSTNSGASFHLSMAKVPGDDRQHRLAIIGPTYSGSAGSLLAGLERRWVDQKKSNGLQFDQVDIAGTTSSYQASNILTFPDAPNFQIHYLSFSNNSHYVATQFLELVKGSGHDISRVAFLVEDDTGYGSATRDIGEHWLGTYRAPITIRFPRGISLLRNAQQEEQGQSGSGTNLAPSPYLRLSLRGSGSEDTVPHFSLQHTPISQEAELSEIARQLQRYRAQFICIFATDILDQIFLTENLHRAVPDARLIAMSGGDLMFEHGTDNVPFVGGLTLTHYNLIAPVSSSKERGAPQRPFASEDAESTYNAASYIFWDGKNQPSLANYRNIFELDDPLMHASLWATIIGRDGYYPVAIVNSYASDSPAILPCFDTLDNTFIECPQPKVATICGAVLESIDEGQNSLGDELTYWFQALKQPLQDLTHVLFPKTAQKSQRFPVNPSLLWLALCIVICGLCMFHAACLGFARFWSPFTRDLAIDENDEPSRRALYIHIGTVMLFCMAFVVAYPIFPALRILRPQPSSVAMAAFTMLVALAAVIYSFIRTRSYAFRKQAGDPKYGRLGAMAALIFSQTFAWKSQKSDKTEESFHWRSTDTYLLFHLMAFVAMIFIPLAWMWICSSGGSGSSPTHVGLFFSYRCLNPASGVSPLLPILLLLFSWYLWSVFQTRRLRFSETSRPRLPGRIASNHLYQLFVSDDELATYETPTRPALYRNITCLLITQEIVGRFFLPNARRKIPFLLGFLYLGLFALCVYGVHVETPDRIFSNLNYSIPTPYEFLVEVLFFPLLMIGLSGWLRMVLIWGALRRGLLKRLEERPIRFAFSRLNKVGWMSMMRRDDLHERSRETARSTESMRQMLHNPDLVEALNSAPKEEEKIAGPYQVLTSDLEQLMEAGQGRVVPSDAKLTPEQWFLSQEDIPDADHRNGLLRTYLVENDYAEFSKRLLEAVLIPYWENESSGIVEGQEPPEVLVQARGDHVKIGQAHELTLHAGSAEEEPAHIRLAEEFVAIRYVSMIRAVLVNVRHLMTFVMCAFVLSMVAWYSYPFQPRVEIDAAFTALLLCMGTGIVWVLAQIHRDPILSRLTRTNANELGFDFYIRIVTFGALPVLTWLAYQFPAVGGTILKYLQPASQVVK